LMRSSSCGQRGACRCWTRLTPGPRSATACKRGHLAIRTGRSRDGQLGPSPGQVGAPLHATSRSRGRDRADLGRGLVAVHPQASAPSRRGLGALRSEVRRVAGR
jgi:hypothetical protein